MIDWLTSTLVSTTVLIVAVLLLREPVRRRFGAAAAYGLWSIPAIRMLLPPFTRTVERSVPAPQETQVASDLAAFESADFPLIVDEPVQAVAIQPTFLEQLGGWTTILALVWLAGALILFTMRMRDYVLQRRAILASGVQVARLGKVRIIRSPLVRGPVAFGLKDKVIAVPRDFDQRFDPAERRLALDHELAHHRAGDLYANMFAFVLLCLQWFNPLAWVAHAAFRFDQEAACDARVLDKAPASDRLPYGTAIAKAASGRALLFASALDNRSSLKRRLSTMVTRPTKRQRLFGTLSVLAALGIALPLSAATTIEYVDVPEAGDASPDMPVPPAPPSPPAAPGAPGDLPLAPAAPPAPFAPGVQDLSVAPPAPPTAPRPVALAGLQPAPKAPKAPRYHSHDNREFKMVDGKIVVIEKGKTRQWSQLSQREKNEIRAEIREARKELAEVEIDREEIRRDMEEAMRDVEVDLAEARVEMAEGRKEIDKAMAEVRRDAAKLRADGKDPELILASLKMAKASLDAIDPEKIAREAALEAMSPAKLDKTLKAAEKSIREAEKKMAAMEKAAARD